MSTCLYLLFKHTGIGGRSLAHHVRTMEVPGYSFWDRPGTVIRAPGEPELPVRCSFYAQSYFRILVADLAIEFRHEATPPPELVAAERLLRSQILNLPKFKLRRWFATLEGWDDDDNAFVHITSEGNSPETQIAEPGAPPNGGPPELPEG